MKIVAKIIRIGKEKNYKKSYINNYSNIISNVNDNADENNNRTTINNSNTNTSNGKILVVYYSAQSHTEDVAKKIANNLSADLFEIIPKDIYTSDDLNWSNENSRVSK